MSKQINAKNRKDIKQYYNIAKICFYIMIFNLVVRLDLWVSIAGMIIILPYLLNRLILKKIDFNNYLNIFNHYLNTIKSAHHEPKKEQEQVIKTTLEPKTHAQNESQSSFNLVELSFDEIWQKCPKIDYFWDEDEINQQSFNQEKSNDAN